MAQGSEISVEQAGHTGHSGHISNFSVPRQSTNVSKLAETDRSQKVGLGRPNKVFLESYRKWLRGVG
jgi:hypothetical protein